MNWKRKWLISLMVTLAMLFSTIGTAAAIGSIGPDVQSSVMLDTDSETQEEPGKEDTREETQEKNLPEDSNDEMSVEAENCPMTDNSKKNGYAEHSYGEDNVGTECDYFGLAGQIARAAEGVVPTYQEAYEAMIALKDEYYEGMTWTNFTPYGSDGPLGDSYVWKGGSIYGADRGVGCAAFVFLLSDAAFGNLPARAIGNGSFTFEDVKVGDILRVNNNSHSVIVLQKSAGGVIIAEANYNKSVHWGRAMSEAEVLAANYIITRYPENYIPPNDPDADKVAHDGTEGNLRWSLTNAGVLTISGNGAIPDYTSTNLPPWNEYNVSTVIIEKGVTAIGSYAFYESNVLSIYIPDSIANIGQYAFYKSALLSVTIPASVETIGNYAFYLCENLTSVTVSEGVKIIGNNAFRGCTSLAYIDFPASITSIGSGAFMSCDMMTRVRFMPGNGKVTLGGGLFAQCWRLTSVTLPYMADCISDNMFSSCSSLSELYIPASVTEIGDEPFTSCYSLQYIYFGGTEAEWKALTNPYLDASLKSTGTTVIYNVPFDDPFAADPNDPGDLPNKDGDGQPVVTISFETGLEGITIPSVKVAPGTTGNSIPLDPPVTTNETIEFEGWYLDAERTIPFDPETEITDDITLYANWTKKGNAVLGDINGNGQPDTDDALAILKHTAGTDLIVNPAIIAIADINGSGQPDTDDALAILRYVAAGEM